jgi:hypothetical protein
MSVETNVFRSVHSVGNDLGKHVQLPYTVRAQDFSQARQASPVPITWGIARRSGIYLFPVWALKSVKVNRQSSGGK